ncbi:ATP-binding protein [Kitasatospora sp. NPDC096077]|uniref:ATP-binding protein n=1 Tax=Kitasatospora sp. NPDC096077 TaxID=3155544 RepID=UPI003324302F
MRAELARAQSLKHVAEERCVRLEARLLAAEATLSAGRAAGWLKAPQVEPESVRMALSREFGQRLDRSLDLATIAAELCALLVLRVADFVSVDLVAGLTEVARDRVQLQLVRSDKLLVEVSDDDHNLPSMRPADELDESGRGLMLVSVLAERWGTARKAVGKVVFFELPLPRG